ncbi:hypothetical protein HPP92_022299 [Vanilla planifolia]|uniref:Uncharacterized protein n=1 Tax=Vanilla planifolia TaxID=51239 RepID=A0A835PRY0_VANPL|nr:hypothetical protein HPP92_022299 [Vanilla planifolia]
MDGGHPPPPLPYSCFWEPPAPAAEHPELQAIATSSVSVAEDLRRALLRTSLELESTRLAAREEFRRLESHALHLTHLLRLATRERDEARLHANSLLLLLSHRRQLPNPLAVDDITNNSLNPPPPVSSSSDEEESNRISQAAPAEAELEEAAMKRGLPEKGKLLEAVMGAGPLLQTLMLAGPLPEWRHPPPAIHSFDIPPVEISGADTRTRIAGSPSPERKVPF